MKCQTTLAACLLLLWMLAAPGRCQGNEKPVIEVKTVPNGIQLICPKGYEIAGNKTVLEYKDENTGEYTCKKSDETEEVGSKIFVKFRSCDNCIKLDAPSVMGIIVGNVVATAVIGVAVYVVASQAQAASGTPGTPNKKGSDRQHLVTNEMHHRVPNDHYQPLNLRGQRDMYDVLNNKKA